MRGATGNAGAAARRAALAARNIEGVSLSEACNRRTLDVVRYRQNIVSAKGIETIIARASGAAA